MNRIINELNAKVSDYKNKEIENKYIHNDIENYINENQNLAKYIESLENNIKAEKNNSNVKFNEWKKRIELFNEIEIENNNYKQSIELKDQELVFANKQIEKLNNDKKHDL